MQTEPRTAPRAATPIFRPRADRRVIDRIAERAVNRAAQILGPMLIVADGTLRSLRRVNYGCYGED
jgi:hypothetical protein